MSDPGASMRRLQDARMLPPLRSARVLQENDTPDCPKCACLSGKPALPEIRFAVSGERTPIAMEKQSNQKEKEKKETEEK